MLARQDLCCERTQQEFSMTALGSSPSFAAVCMNGRYRAGRVHKYQNLHLSRAFWYNGGEVFMSGDSELEKRKRRDFEDQQNELAGRETGRMARFGVGAARAQEIKERERKERAYRDALDRLLATDPEYQELYENLGDRLGEAEVMADQTIEAIRTALATQQIVNQDMRDRAPKIDGKAVFRYADGSVVDEDGNEVDPIIAAEIIWPDNAPSAEDYFAGVERESDMRASLETHPDSIL